MKKGIAIVLSIIFFIIPCFAFADQETYSNESGMPARYLNECPVHGTIHTDRFQQRYANNDFLLVWTPYDYDTSGETKYEIILLLNGGGGNLHNWMDDTITVFANKHYHHVQMSNIYDWISYEKVCKPFIVCTLNNRQEKNRISKDIIPALSYIADNYHTYAESGEKEDIIAARDHITIGGLSDGARTVYYFMSHHIEYAANYIPLSMTRDRELNDRSFLKSIERYQILNYFGGAGKKDQHKHALTGPSDEVFYGKYAARSKYVIYPWGHDWSTWSYAIYDALIYMFGVPREEAVRNIAILLIKRIWRIPVL